MGLARANSNVAEMLMFKVPVPPLSSKRPNIDAGLQALFAPITELLEACPGRSELIVEIGYVIPNCPALAVHR